MRFRDIETEFRGINHMADNKNGGAGTVAGLVGGA